MFSRLFNWLSSGNAMNDIAQPSFNIDGTPMVGSMDIHGNPFGVTSHDSSANTSDFMSSGSGFSSFGSGTGSCGNLFD